MGRPRKDPSAIVHPRVQPPAQISERMRALWEREFDRFPPGYYLPVDTNAMLTYLHVVSEYDAAMACAAAAKKPAEARMARAEVRAIRKQLVTMQRALRMYPSNRSDPDRMTGLAAQPTAQRGEETEEAEQEPAWRALFRQSGASNEGERGVQ